MRMSSVQILCQKLIKGGIVPIYKPCGIRTMEQVDDLKQRLRQLLKMNKLPKTGHGGVLDNFAHGVIIVGFGAKCKDLNYYLKQCRKEYIAQGRFGSSTDTDSIHGKVICNKSFSHITETSLLDCINQFFGNSTQIVPLYSNVKIGGKRLRDYASEGIQIQPKAHSINVSCIQLLDFALPDFRIIVNCSSGTYIRSIVRDIGTMLDSVAYTHSLCRIKQGPFSIQDCFLINECTSESLIDYMNRHNHYAI